MRRVVPFRSKWERRRHEKKKEAVREGHERVEKEGVSFVAPEFASNIYATPATMGTISVAWQPLCSQPVLSSANTSPCSSAAIATNSFSSPLPLHLSLSLSLSLVRSFSFVRLARSNLPSSHFIGRGTEMRSDWQCSLRVEVRKELEKKKEEAERREDRIGKKKRREREFCRERKWFFYNRKTLDDFSRKNSVFIYKRILLREKLKDFNCFFVFVYSKN